MYFEGSYVPWPFRGFPRSLCQESGRIHGRPTCTGSISRMEAHAVLCDYVPPFRAGDRQENGAVSLPRRFSDCERKVKSQALLFLKFVAFNQWIPQVVRMLCFVRPDERTFSHAAGSQVLGALTVLLEESSPHPDRCSPARGKMRFCGRKSSFLVCELQAYLFECLVIFL